MSIPDPGYTYGSFDKIINKKNWINLKICKKGGVYKVKIDHNLVYNTPAEKSQKWTNVNVIVGNTSENQNLTLGYYRNFDMYTSKCTNKPSLVTVRPPPGTLEQWS